MKIEKEKLELKRAKLLELVKMNEHLADIANQLRHVDKPSSLAPTSARDVSEMVEPASAMPTSMPSVATPSSMPFVVKAASGPSMAKAASGPMRGLRLGMMPIKLKFASKFIVPLSNQSTSAATVPMSTAFGDTSAASVPSGTALANDVDNFFEEEDYDEE